jgi:uroporphyrinogen III methyltransferase/synthase
VGNTKSSVEWAKLAYAVDTLVILMGVKNLPYIVAELLCGGVSPHMPAAVIQQGTSPQQESVIGTLKNIVERAAHLRSPAVIVLGQVVELNAQLQWFAPEAMLREKLVPRVEEVIESPGLDVGATGI